MSRDSLFSQPARRAAVDGFSGGRSVLCAAVDAAATAVETKKKSTFELPTLTAWLLEQEQADSIDAEITIVRSSISMACKQIASLVQRAAISNLAGVQGGVNVQGEDQKKLDVVSNEGVRWSRVEARINIGGILVGPAQGDCIRSIPSQRDCILSVQRHRGWGQKLLCGRRRRCVVELL